MTKYLRGVRWPLWTATATSLGILVTHSLDFLSQPPTYGSATSTPDPSLRAHSPSWTEAQGGRRPRLVICGSGWVARSLISLLDTRLCEVMVISERNHFLYTPLLPASCVGSVEHRSIVSPVREVLANRIRWDRRKWWRSGQPSRLSFLHARVDDIDPRQKRIYCSSAHTGARLQVDYDVAVLAVGSSNDDCGMPGVSEHCHFLKAADDARAIRRAVTLALEHAAEPFCTPQERSDLLHFCVVGAGPAGTEFAAELHDFLSEDAHRLYPAELLEDVRISVIQSGRMVLNSYDRRIAEHATEKFQRDGIQLLLNCRVVDVQPHQLTVLDKDTQQRRQVPYGVCVWTTGVAMQPLARRLAQRIGPDIQSNHHALIVDSHLAVLGDPSRSLYAAGDCSTLRMPEVYSHARELFEEADEDGDGRIQYYEFAHLLRSVRDRFPQLREHAPEMELRLRAARDTVTRDNFTEWLRDIDAHTTSLPATAQVAHQQGKYLAGLLNRRFECWPHPLDETDPSVCPAFVWHNLGATAYIGGETSVMEVPYLQPVYGVYVYWLWYGYSLLHQFSWRSRFLVAGDFIKTRLLGRDTSMF
ncbi:hypothetical protein CDCA_CDCA07G2176 [Cyanidium caldarium]|uniref:NADH:ubiquinone reductase (non-electrogenic) n=1 Tax=Cyanidium caldarium TaxID=2771 RepID=A0AAV9IVG5_CYACA|nr:hypothetical protein CDCA_CDCA07G2176 [Cyanidium caldarium]